MQLTWMNVDLFVTSRQDFTRVETLLKVKMNTLPGDS